MELYYTREGFTDEEIGALLSALDYYSITMETTLPKNNTISQNLHASKC